MHQQTARGRILLVQEERLRLWTDDGHGLLLTLSHRLRGLDRQLRQWQHSGRRVEVQYDGSSNYQDAIVRKIQPEPTPAGG